MKKGLLLFTLLLSIMVLLPSCNKSSNDMPEQNVELTLIIDSKLLSTGPASAANFQYQATVEETGQKLIIPINDIVGFYFESGFTYKILVIKYNEVINGVATGGVFYKLVKIISKTPVNNEAEDPTTDPT